MSTFVPVTNFGGAGFCQAGPDGAQRSGRYLMIAGLTISTLSRTQAYCTDRLANPNWKSSITVVGGASGSVAAPIAMNNGVKCSTVG